MDIEKARRAELIEALGDDFICFEEVRLRHPLFTQHCVRADIVAVPLDQRFYGYALAFEVKEPKSGPFDYATWSQTLRQASDYTYAKIEPQRNRSSLDQFVGRRISAAFIFPAPAWAPSSTFKRDPDPYVRPGDEQIVTGAMHLALHFRVGRAYWEPKSSGRRFVLCFGPNDVWRSDVGFTNSSIGLVTGKRTVGSQKIDVMSELDGIGGPLPQFD